MQPEKWTKEFDEDVNAAQLCTRLHLGWLQIFLQCGIILSAWVLTGCETLCKPSPSQVAAINSGKASIVLLRTTLAETNKGETNIKSPYFDYKIINLGGAEIGSKHLYDMPLGPSSPAGQPGWKYFMLEPGDYYFQQELQLGYTTNLANFAVTFHVPTNTPMIYVGSFCYALETLPKASLWANLVTEDLPRYRLHNLGVIDESPQAAQISANFLLIKFGPPLTCLAIPYEELPGNHINWTNCRITRVEFGADGKFTSSDVGVEAAGKAALPLVAPMLVTGGVMLDASTNKLGSSPNATADSGMVVVGSALIFASAPIVFLADKTFGDAARKKWKPFEYTLGKEFDGFGFATNLDRAICAQMHATGNATGGKTNQFLGKELTLQMQTYRAMIRQTRLHGFALEIAVRVSLKDSQSGELLFQHNFIYTDLAAAMADFDSFLLPNETPITAQSQVCKLEQYESSSGTELLKQQLIQAVAVISNDIVNRLRNAGIEIGSR